MLLMSVFCFRFFCLFFRPITWSSTAFFVVVGGWDGCGDGMEWHGMEWDDMRWDGMGWTGFVRSARTAQGSECLGLERRLSHFNCRRTPVGLSNSDAAILRIGLHG